MKKGKDKDYVNQDLEQQTFDAENFKTHLKQLLSKCRFSDSKLGESFCASNKIRRPSEEFIDYIVSALSQYSNLTRDILTMVHSNFYDVQSRSTSSELKEAEMQEILVRIIEKLVLEKTELQPRWSSEIKNVNKQVTDELNSIV